MKKICLVSHSLQMGGMERAMAGYANYLADRDDVEVYLILLLKVDRFYHLNENIKIIEPKFSYKKKYRQLYLIKILSWLRVKVKSINPDTVLSFGEYWNSVMLVATFGLRVPKYISDRSKPTINWKGFNELVRQLTYRTATGFIAQTKLSADIIAMRYGLTNSIIAGNPIREIVITNNNERENIILSVGRLIEFKQFSELIDIFSKIKNSENWKLIILGDGPLANDLQKQIDLNELNEKVFLKGAVTDVDKYLTKSKIFAFTSYYEGFPNALAEGMMAGCACIAFDCEAGPSDIIENGINGFLIPLNEFDLFRVKLTELINNSSLIEKFSKIGVESIQKYRHDIVNERILNFILQNKK